MLSREVEWPDGSVGTFRDALGPGGSPQQQSGKRVAHPKARKGSAASAAADAWPAAIRAKAVFALFDGNNSGFVTHEEVREVLYSLLDAAHAHPAALHLLHPECAQCTAHTKAGKSGQCTCPCAAPGSEASVVIASLSAELMAHAGSTLQSDGGRVRGLTPNGLAAWLHARIGKVAATGRG